VGGFFVGGFNLLRFGIFGAGQGTRAGRGYVSVL